MPWQLKQVKGSWSPGKKCLHSVHMTLVTGLLVSSSAVVVMMCQEKMKATFVNFNQDINIAPTATVLKKG